MAVTSAGTVKIAKPDDVSTSAMMGRFRDWLDAHKIEPKRFKSGLLGDGSIAFEVAFHDNEHATLFNRQFG